VAVLTRNVRRSFRRIDDEETAELLAVPVTPEDAEAAAAKPGAGGELAPVDKPVAKAARKK
jgi:hypothetical protein